MKRHEDDIRGEGIIVGGAFDQYGNYYYAEVVPSGGAWYRQVLPWVGRWWFEVNRIDKRAHKFPDGKTFWQASCAYQKGGSGGGYTLRGCTVKALDAIDLLAEDDRDETFSQTI